MPKKLLFSLTLIILWVNIYGQTFTLENIFKSNTFKCATLDDFRFFGDSNYIRIENNHIIRRSFSDTSVHEILVDAKVVQQSLVIPNWTLDDYEYKGSSRFLLKINGEAIFRRSKQYQYVLYDCTSHTVMWSSPAKVLYADVSSDCRYVSYVSDHNLYIFDMVKKKTKAVTSTGKYNELLQGMADWLYEEEFYLTQAYTWNPSGTKIAYLSFDIKAVETFNFTSNFETLYPETESLKYPKAGEPIAQVSLHIYDVKKKKTTTLSVAKDYYIPKIFWKDDDKVAYIYMPRIQNELYIKCWDGIEESVLYSETSPTFIEQPLAADFDKEGALIITSDKSGYSHLYRIQYGNEIQLTTGDYNVTHYYGYFPDDNRILYQSNEGQQVDKSIYFIYIDTKIKERITPHSGTYELKKIGNHNFVISYSSAYIAPRYYLTDYKGTIQKVMLKNDSLDDILPSEKKFFTIEKNNYSLPAYYLLPPDYDSTATYPLLIYCYGGPRGEEVTNDWQEGKNYWTYYMASQGYIVACTDNRGVGNNDKDANKAIYGRMGVVDVEDQTDMVTLLMQKFKIDTGDISIFGWSYGGYLAAKCILEHPEVFKKAVSIAPVTDWRYYDAAYTERYMGMPLWNIKGYEKASLPYNASKLQGKLLLIHGSADDNVHLQNTLNLVKELQKQQKDFELMIYPDKNHSIAGSFSRYHLFKKVTEFIMDEK